MSAKTPKIRNPLMHNGASQFERLTHYLIPENLQIDDRSTKDLIVAAHRYAKLLCYFNEGNQADGDWTCFWEVEPLTFLAILAEIDTDIILKEYNDLEIALAQAIEEGKEPEEIMPPGPEGGANLLDLIEFIFQQALSIENALKTLPEDLPLYQEIQTLVRLDSIGDDESLEYALLQLVGFHKHAHYEIHQESLSEQSYQSFFGTHWNIPDLDTFDKIKSESKYDRGTLRALFRQFFQVLVKIRQRANYWFDKMIEEPQLHEPHIALFLTFLRLFHHARNSLNTLTGKHLNFYYENILCTARKPEVPDEAFIIFELAKGIDELLIEKGTALLAGKDKDGRPLIFTVIEDWVVRKAKVQSIKNTYIDISPTNSGRILANPDVNLAYDNGNILPNEAAESFRPMGCDDNLPDGEVGFAIASPQLILREGKRIIDVEIQLAPNTVTPLTATDFRLELSTEDSWFLPQLNDSIVFDTSIDQNISLEQGAFNIRINPALYVISIRIILEKDDPSIVTLGPDLAALAGFDTSWPMMRLLLIGSENPVNNYQHLRQLIIEQITIRVDVRDIRENLIIQSDQGVFDGTQKIYPFGPVPEIGHFFYVGSTEVFQKALKTLDIDFQWIAPPPNFTTHYAEYTSVGLGAPAPFVNIDFIDRADISVPEQVSMSGELVGPNNTLTGFITDVNGVPLVGVQVNEDPPGNSTISDVNGDYSLNLINPNAEIIFSAVGDYETLTVEIENSATINVVLFPKNVTNFGIFNNVVTGRITNVFGDLLSGVNIDSLSGPTSTSGAGQGVRNNNYIQNVNQSDQLSFAFLNYISLSGISIDNWSVIDVILHPDQVAASGPFTGAPLANAVINGFIQGFGQTAAPDATVVSRDATNGITISTTSRDDGSFSLPTAPNPDDVRFSQHEQFQEVVKGDAPYNIKLFEKSHLTKRSAFTGTVKGIVRTTFGNDLLDGVVIAPLNTSGIAPTTSNALGQFQFDNIPPNAQLNFTKPGYGELTIELAGTLQLEIWLTKDAFIENSSSADLPVTGTAAVTGKAYDLLGSPLVGVVVTGANTGNTDTTDAAGSYSFNAELSESLSFVLAGFLTTNEIVTKSENEVVLSPDVSPPAGSSGFIELNIIDHLGQTGTLTSGLAIYAQSNNAADQPIKIELPAATTTFSLVVPIATPSWSFYLEANGNSTIPTDAISEGTGINLLFIKQLARNNPFDGNINGQVIAPDSQPIEGISVTITNIGSPNSTTTNANGEFSFIGIAANIPTYEFTFRHAAYEELDVSLDEKSFAEIVLIPRTAFYVLGGQVTDIFDVPLFDVAINIAGTTIEANSANDGYYEIGIPDPPALGTPVIEFTYPGFVNLPVNLNTYQPVYSQADIRLYFDQLNYQNLIKNGSIVNQFNVNINALNLKRDVRTQEFDRYSPTLKRGFVRFELDNSDFFHKEYTKALIWHTTDMEPKDITIDPNNPSNSLPGIPNEPYTPATNGISLSYTSEQIISGKENRGIDKYYHLLPFAGNKEIPLQIKGHPNCVLLYPYCPCETQDKFASGNLYLGISDLKPGGTLSLLLQIVEGSALEPDWLPPDIQWSYLTSDNTWTTFETTHILRDTTRGLTRTGMVQLQIPKTLVKENTMLNDELYWLRIATVENYGIVPCKSVKALPYLAAIRAQALLSQFDNRENDLAHLADPLPQQTISKLLISNASVKKIEQPFSSFNGRLPENGNEYYRRVSERLRHRDRAIQIWDYERLLLEKFPQIYRAKCLNHTNLVTELAPGYVMISAIPDQRKRSAVLKAQPRFSFGDLTEMADYLRSKTNLFVAMDAHHLLAICQPVPDAAQMPYLQVVNPDYEPIRLCFKVQFQAGVDAEFHRFKLDEELKIFLAPWLLDETADINFGTKLYLSKILEFIETQEYVDVVVDLQAFHAREDKELDLLNRLYLSDADLLKLRPLEVLKFRKVLENCRVKQDWITPTTSRSILTTYLNKDKTPNSTDHIIFVHERGNENDIDWCQEKKKSII